MQRYLIVINGAVEIPAWAWTEETAIGKALTCYEYQFGPDRPPVASLTVRDGSTDLATAPRKPTCARGHEDYQHWCSSCVHRPHQPLTDRINGIAS